MNALNAKPLRPTLATLAAAALLAACGGGGSDAPAVVVPTGARAVTASAGSDLNVNNYNTRSDAVVRAVASAVGSTALAGAVAAPRERAQAATGGARATAGPASPLLMTALLQRALSGVNLRQRTQAVIVPRTVGCAGGGVITVSGTDSDDNGLVSAGDSIQFSAVNCVALAGSPSVNGVFGMQMEAVDISGDAVLGMQVLVTTGNFGVTGYGVMNGSARLWASGLDGNSPILRISHLDTSVTVGAQTALYRFDAYVAITNGVPTFEVSGGIVVEGQTYAVELVNSFVNSPPSLGALRLKDAAGDAVKLVTRSATTFDLEFYGAAAPTTLVSVTPDLFWSSYQQ